MFHIGPMIAFGRIVEECRRTAKRFLIGLSILVAVTAWIIWGHQLTLSLRKIEIPRDAFGYAFDLGLIAWFLYVLLKPDPSGKVKNWLLKPLPCRKCGGTKFGIPPWWDPETMFITLTLEGIAGWCRLPLPPPLECVNCKELKI